MGNSVLEKLAARAPVMKTVSLPRGRHRLHTMPTSTGYEIRSNSSYDWNGRRRGLTPFTVLQHTVAGAGNLQYERRRYRLRPGDTMLVIVPHNHRYWVEDGGRWEFFWRISECPDHGHIRPNRPRCLARSPGDCM